MMGATDQSNKREARVRVAICAGSHVDEAYTSLGFVSKRDALELEAGDAKRLIAMHPYLAIVKD